MSDERLEGESGSVDLSVSTSPQVEELALELMSRWRVKLIEPDGEFPPKEEKCH